MKSLKTSVSHSFSPTLLATSIWFLSKTKVFFSLQQKNQENLSLVSGFFLHFPTRETAARSGTALHPPSSGECPPFEVSFRSKAVPGRSSVSVGPNFSNGNRRQTWELRCQPWASPEKNPSCKLIWPQKGVFIAPHTPPLKHAVIIWPDECTGSKERVFPAAVSKKRKSPQTVILLPSSLSAQPAERCARLPEQAAQSEAEWEIISCKYIKVSSSQCISHANSHRDRLLKLLSTPEHLLLKIKTLLLGQMKGLHQQPHGLAASPVLTMEICWNHSLLLFPSSIPSFGCAARLQTSVETNYPLVFATCKSNSHLGEPKEQHVQQESIATSDDTPPSPSSTEVSQHLRSRKGTSRCKRSQMATFGHEFLNAKKHIYTNPEEIEIIPGRATEIPNSGCQPGAKWL